MYFLGIDQSMRSTGFAVVSDVPGEAYTGTVAPKKLSGVARLAFIRDEVRQIFAAYPDIRYAAMEGYAYDVGAGRVFELGEVGGLIKLCLFDDAIPCVIVPPTSLKQFVTGSGAATKEQMRISVQTKWGLDLAQNDECDAFGLAQVARAYHLKKGSTRSELEVIKKLSDTGKKVSLVSFGSPSLSV
jgi:Holliday junction resolvasome RuvABC endonuclease subunit